MCKVNELEKLRKKLEEMIQIRGIEDDDVLRVSQELDLYILECYDKK
ncbi:aspartyl-phosphate phosphatase Spo0E family protein [Clostridium sp.]